MLYRTSSMMAVDEQLFSKKRIIITTAELDGKTLNEEEAIDLAIDVGAEEVVVLNQDEENSHLLKVSKLDLVKNLWLRIYCLRSIS